MGEPHFPEITWNQTLTDDSRVKWKDIDAGIFQVSSKLFGVQDVGQLWLAVGTKTAPTVWSLVVQIGPNNSK